MKIIKSKTNFFDIPIKVKYIFINQNKNCLWQIIFPQAMSYVSAIARYQNRNLQLKKVTIKPVIFVIKHLTNS